MFIEVENSRTFHRPKLLPEDLACVLFDREGRRLIVEGIAYRYIIRAADLLGLQVVRAAAGAPGLEVSYSVGGARLSLTLIYQSARSELRRQTIGGQDPFIRNAISVLGEPPGRPKEGQT